MLERTIRLLVVVCLLSLVGSLRAQGQRGSAQGQQPAAQAQQATAAVAEPEAPRVVLQAEQTASVLRLMKFSGLLRDGTGKARTGVVGLTFALYKDQQVGSPLWLEVHNALLDEQGRYTVLLGSTKSEGLPLELFSTGEARWLGVQLNLPGEEEQPRVLLVSVPYALKAADAETLGGKPPSAFLLAEKAEGREAAGKPEAEAGKEAAKAESAKEGPERQQVISGTVGKIAKFVGPNPDDLGNSNLTEGAGGEIGVATATPFSPFQVSRAVANTISGDDQANTAGMVVAGSDALVRLQLGVGGSGLGPFGGWIQSSFDNGGSSFGPEPLLLNPIGGNVGVGTAAPFSRLQVSRTVTNTISGDDQATTAGIVVAGSDALVRLQLGVGGSGLGPFGGWIQSSFDNGGSSFGPEPLLLNPIGGNVGIGTATPGQKLTVAGTIESTSGGFKFPDSSVQTTAGGGDITAVLAGTGLTGGAASGDATLSLSAASRVRGITYLAGCDSCGALTDNDDQKTIYQNVIGAMAIDSVTCFSDTVTPTAPVINLQRQVGVAAPANILSGDLTCSTAGASAPGFAISTLNLDDKVDFVMVTAGGGAKRVTVVIKATLN